MNAQTTLITGASSGIGLSLAREFAKHGHDLVLVAPDFTEVQNVAEDIRQTYGVEIHSIGKDLERADSADEIFDELYRAGVQVEILVNNAGLGQRGRFWEIPLEKDISMIRLNIEAVIRMTKCFLPSMLARGHGRILNTASVAGFEPGPLLAVYHATKAFVLSFSEALATELEQTSISVTALCPGPTDTDFFPKADMMATRAFQKANLMAPQDVAKDGYEAVMRGERVTVSGTVNKTLVFARRVMTESAQAKLNQQFYEEVDPSECKRERGELESKAAHDEWVRHSHSD
ncbi:MAG: short-chain dehydrogenase/reductase [Verrucomicrobia bacterium]|jgi:short-subunit dehydrogenase|nr:short-chain dehydrogenase/reductase [Verrucomicrobiota bacterium]